MHERELRITAISDDKATDDEYLKFSNRRKKAKHPAITKKYCEDKRRDLAVQYRKHYHEAATERTVEQTVKIRERVRGMASVNLVQNRMELTQDIEKLHLQHFPELYLARCFPTTCSAWSGMTGKDGIAPKSNHMDL